MRWLWSIVLLLSACATDPSSKDEADSQNGDPIRDALREADPGGFYIANDVFSFTFTASNQKMTGFGYNTAKAKEWVKQIGKHLEKERWVNDYRLEVYLTLQRFGSVTLKEITKTGRRLYEWKLSQGDRSPLSPEAQLDLAIAAFQQQNHSLAHYHLDQVADAADPDTRAGALNLRGLIAHKEWDIPLATSLWSQALQVSPQYMPARLNLGLTALQHADFKTAERWIGSLGSDLAVNSRITIARLTEESGKAQSLCRKIVNKKPEYRPASYNCALNQFQSLKQFKPAKATLQRLVKTEKARGALEPKSYAVLEKIDAAERRVKNSRKGKKTGNPKSKKAKQ